MPLPFILGGVAAVAGLAGVVGGIDGAVKMKDANDTMKIAERKHQENIARFEKESEQTNQVMDKLGELELEILKSFENFSDTIEKIQNRPEFKQYSKDGVKLPKYNAEELKQASIGAGLLLGSIGGAAVGTAGGFAAAGATTSAVMALGTASTGTAISSLSGAAATKATLAALGGGALKVGGGGIALGTTVLGATTLGVGLLVGGLIFNATGSKLSDKADEAYHQMKEAEKTINTICSYLQNLTKTANGYTKTLETINKKYLENFNYISYIVNKQNKRDWNEFTIDEKLATHNTVLLVGLLYKMCQVNLVLKSEKKDDMNKINKDEVDKTVKYAEEVLKEVA